MTDTANMNPNPGPRPTRPLVFPIILIVIGGLFLYANWRPGIDAWRILGTYWPLILIFLGLGKMWDNTRGGARQGYSGGVVIALLAFVIVIAVVLSHNRSFRRTWRSSTEMQHSVRTIAVSGAKNVRATVDMSAGELTIGGGTDNLLDATFEQRADMAPKVDYDRNGDTGVLKISEDDSGSHVVFPGNHDSHWNLRFGGGLPLDLKVDMGAGQGNLNLRGMPITKLELSIGAGQVNADLTGDRQQDLNADIEGGVGEAVIRLPRNVAVEVRASGGIGSVDTHGLRKEGDRYVNDAYGKPGPMIHLKVQGGIGHINLTQE